MLGILILVMFKDTGLTFLGPIKKPLDALGEVINVLRGIVTLPIAVTYFSDGTAYEIADLIVSISHGLLPVAHAAESVTLASPSALLLLPGKIIGTMMGLLIYSVVWILGNTIEVLILISPVPFIDTALKSLRSFLLVVFTFIAYQFPVQGAIIALIIIFISWRVFCWSYRLFTFGFLFGADFLGFCANFFKEKRQNTTMEEKNGILAFTGEGIVRPKNRSLGRLYKNESGDLEFIYYPWLILPSRHISLDKENTVVVRGKIFNVIGKRDSSTEKNQTLFTLPPRYRGKEDSLGTYLELPIIK